MIEPCRWWVYLGSKKYQYSVAFDIFSFTAFIGYMLPAKLGFPLRVLMLKSILKISIISISSTLAIDGLIYYACWGTAAFLAVIGNPANGIKISEDALIAIIIAVIVALTSIFLYKRMRSGTWRISSWVSKIRLVSVSASAHLSAKSVVAGAALSLFDIVLYVARHSTLLEMLGYSLPLSALFSVTAISVFAGMISFMPMGLVGYDLVLMAILTSNGVDLADAIAVAVTNRLANITCSIAFGILASRRLGLRVYSPKKIREFALDLRSRNRDRN
jgi:uncharacterized membrane protein YbhN (UPF0104 family)